MAKARKKIKATKRKLAKVANKMAKAAGPMYEKAIVSNILKGKSPVKGHGRFENYSESYRDQIKNKVAFRMVGGKPFPVAKINPDAETKAEKKENRETRKFIKELNNHLIKNGKRVRPVNLKVTGKMLDSFYWKVKKNTLIMGFKDKLSDIHNRLGAGKSKVVRRMLPTRQGESFTIKIQRDIKKKLKALADGLLRKP